MLFNTRYIKKFGNYFKLVTPMVEERDMKNEFDLFLL